jgi:hypothetical protein
MNTCDFTHMVTMFLKQKMTSLFSNPLKSLQPRRARRPL